MTTEQGLNDQKYLRRWSNKNFLKTRGRPLTQSDLKDIPVKPRIVDISYKNGSPCIEMEEL
jgi:hypothetical protein